MHLQCLQPQHQLMRVTLPASSYCTKPLFSEGSVCSQWRDVSRTGHKICGLQWPPWGLTELGPHCSPASLCSMVSHGSNVADFKPRGLSALVAALWARWETKSFTHSFSLIWMRPRWTRSQWLIVWIQRGGAWKWWWGGHGWVEKEMLKLEVKGESQSTKKQSE